MSTGVPLLPALLALLLVLLRLVSAATPLFWRIARRRQMRVARVSPELIHQLSNALRQLGDLLLQRPQPCDLRLELGDPIVSPVVRHEPSNRRFPSGWKGSRNNGAIEITYATPCRTQAAPRVNGYLARENPMPDRVGWPQGIAPRGSHRSGLADFPHPAPRRTVSLRTFRPRPPSDVAKETGRPSRFSRRLPS